jgi:hypothetical protein
MKKSDLLEKPVHYETYIQLVEDLPIKAAFDKYLIQFQNQNWNELKELGDKVYQPGKWTAREIIQHIIDWERIFSYRALIYVRREENKPPGHDQDLMTANSKANQRSLESLKDDFIFTRSATISLFQSFDKEDLMKPYFYGENHQNQMSVFALGYSIIGHQIHHLNIITERYLPLL